ncbi:MAG: DUF4338 domain-containing protein [Proteobacteria bacterium]|nr:DUF4338 domain-containing protein [Pseudomonadota bacterium]MBU1582293.1 DUF4338 domain-containing protein [Pseudomonadota bacterium]MBU2454623.1 DUF4338 domain-containing protein [Pseudomonadota bacterium]MBU2632015.1 DUF4338 domain-containing protein [Pseudomonadota bacterium]
MEPLVIRNRKITAQDLQFIQSVVHEYWGKGRTQISKILCTKWNWVQPNGRLKDMACREVLLTLYRKGLLDYPPPLQSSNNVKRAVSKIPVKEEPINCHVNDLDPIWIKMVRNTDQEPLYDSLVDQYHYLGHAQIVGNYLKYMAFAGETPVACIGWGSAAWAVQSREEFIGWTKPVKNKNLHFVVNNTRFLVLPFVTVKCLASKVLALNIKRISSDWIKVYNYPLYMLETFVEQERFKGTCYKASNWIQVGETKGTSKKGHKHLKHGKIKDVYLYPLDKNFKKLLVT